MFKIIVIITTIIISGCASFDKDPKPPCACYNPQPVNQQFGA